MEEEKKKFKKPSYSFKSESDVINFGINKGRTIGDVMRSEPDYIDWCIKNFKGFKLWKKLALKFEEIKKEKSDGKEGKN